MAATGKPRVPVNVGNFVRAETDLYFGRTVKSNGIGTLAHNRRMTPVDAQNVVRMNRDTIYSSGVFDLEAAPLAIVLPDPGRRFMSMQVISQDHYTTEVVYAPGRHSITRERVGTRYVCIVVRTLADPRDPADMAAAHALQDAIDVGQAATGRFEAPDWDPVSQDKARRALAELASLGFSDEAVAFGSKAEVDPVRHLVGTAIGWGGNPRRAAVYEGVFPAQNDGRTPYALTVGEVPVDGFWSLSVYNAAGYFEKNDHDAYSVNSLTATRNADGGVTVRFGACGPGTPNCLPIAPGWNYTVRLYRPRQAILDGSWKFPRARPMA